jgi:hypothetical protein
MDAIRLPINRPFSWKTLWILGRLFIAGNVASISLVQEERGALRKSLPEILLLVTLATALPILVFPSK